MTADPLMCTQRTPKRSAGVVAMRAVRLRTGALHCLAARVTKLWLEEELQLRCVVSCIVEPTVQT